MGAVSDRVIGVEIVPEAVEKAKENAALNGLNNCTFICDDVFHALDSMPEKPDIMILDPPRDGVAKKALEKILSYGVESIVSGPGYPGLPRGWLPGLENGRRGHVPFYRPG